MSQVKTAELDGTPPPPSPTPSSSSVSKVPSHPSPAHSAPPPPPPTIQTSPFRSSRSSDGDGNVSSTSEIRSRRDYDFFVKFLSLGDSGVGKTAMLKRFVDDEFSADFHATVGIDFCEKIVDFQPEMNENNNRVCEGKSGFE